MDYYAHPHRPFGGGGPAPPQSQHHHHPPPSGSNGGGVPPRPYGPPPPEPHPPPGRAARPDPTPAYYPHPDPAADPAPFADPDPRPPDPARSAAAAPYAHSPPVYDLFFDLPHPAASYRCPRARVIDAPNDGGPPPAGAGGGGGGGDVDVDVDGDGAVHPGGSDGGVDGTGTGTATGAPPTSREVAGELYDPENVTRIHRFAFPEHDEQGFAAKLSFRQAVREADSSGSGSGAAGGGGGANLNRYDLYQSTFTPQHHTFALQLSDGTRVHGHVRRYLPPHPDSQRRSDVGRRGARAMVLLTRASGGERMYASVLRTLEAVMIRGFACRSSMGGVEGVEGGEGEVEDDTPERTFLHALYRSHADLCWELASARVGSDGNEGLAESMIATGGDGEIDAARQFVERNENLFRLTVRGIEFYRGYEVGVEGGAYYDSSPLMGDYVSFRLPPPLQPGYGSSGPQSYCEDIRSPVLPLLRCLGAPHTLRVLSALLCERRIVLISRSPSRLSACVRSASALLAQGLLVWGHVHIPVLPPHLLKYLAARTPYLIGLLDRYEPNLDVIPGMSDVLSVNLDRNELRTYNASDPDGLIPDLLKSYRRNRNADSVFSPAEVLARDMAEILKSDRRAWAAMGAAGGGGGVGVGASDGGTTTVADVPTVPVPAPTTAGEDTSASDGMTMDGTAGAATPPAKRRFMGLFRRRSSAEDAGNTDASAAPRGDAAAILGAILRASQLGGGASGRERTDGGSGNGGGGGADGENGSDAPPDPGDGAGPTDDGGRPHERGWDQESIPDPFRPSLDPSSACENERGEEEVRAALVSFYLYLFGDMGAYLSEDTRDGTLWLDRKKFLLLKKRMGEQENSTMYRVMVKLSGSSMFESFVRGRVYEMDRSPADRALTLPHHVPLFALCERFLRVHDMEYTMSNVRRVVSATVVSGPDHAAVETSEAARAKALSLTSDRPYDGDVTEALAGLVEGCREVDGRLVQVMAVVWARMAEQRRSLWKHPLLALHLLKNLLLHGPLTVISEASDGIDRVRSLRYYTSKHSAESVRQVRLVASQVYDMLVDRPGLFLRRRRIAAERTFQKGGGGAAAGAGTGGGTDGRHQEPRWGDYLVRRLPVTVAFGSIHSLVRPDESSVPSVPAPVPALAPAASGDAGPSPAQTEEEAEEAAVDARPSDGEGGGVAPPAEPPSPGGDAVDGEADDSSAGGGGQREEEARRSNRRGAQEDEDEDEDDEGGGGGGEEEEAAAPASPPLAAASGPPRSSDEMMRLLSFFNSTVEEAGSGPGPKGDRRQPRGRDEDEDGNWDGPSGGGAGSARGLARGRGSAGGTRDDYEDEGGTSDGFDSFRSVRSMIGDNDDDDGGREPREEPDRPGGEDGTPTAEPGRREAGDADSCSGPDDDDGPGGEAGGGGPDPADRTAGRRSSADDPAGEESDESWESGGPSRRGGGDDDAGGPNRDGGAPRDGAARREEEDDAARSEEEEGVAPRRRPEPAPATDGTSPAGTAADPRPDLGEGAVDSAADIRDGEADPRGGSRSYDDDDAAGGCLEPPGGEMPSGAAKVPAPVSEEGDERRPQDRGAQADTEPGPSEGEALPCEPGGPGPGPGPGLSSNMAAVD